jgi:hypothetical protein
LETNEESVADRQGEFDQEQAVVIDLLSGEPRPASELEELVQRTIHVMAEEYGYPLECMARNVPVQVEVSGRRQRKRADLVIFSPGYSHDLANAERIIVIRKPRAPAFSRDVRFIRG